MPRNSHPATRNACLLCQQRKRKCDGRDPCANCTRLGRECSYTQRRGRGLGKSKARIASLEQRLAALESASSTHGAVHDGGSAEPTSTVTDTAQEKLVGVSTNASKFLPAPASPFLEFAALFAGAQERIESQLDAGPFPRKVFAPLPPRELVINILEKIVEVFSNAYLFPPLFKETAVLGLVERQFEAGASNCRDDPVTWAITNTVLAAAIQFEADSESLSSVQRIVWAYFKNAYSVFPEIIIQGNDLVACEALVCMSAFLISTPDGRTAVQVTASASRLLSLLSEKSQHNNMRSGITEQNNRLFWIVYILKVDCVFKYGCLLEQHPYPILPDISSYTETTSLTTILSYFAQVSAIKSRIQSRVILPQEPLSHSQLLKLCFSLEHELRTWHESLVPFLSGNYKPESTSSYAAILLRFIFQNALITVHTVAMHASKDPQTNEAWHEHARHIHQISWPRCVVAARATLDLTSNLASFPFNDIWPTLCYPLSATLVLLLAILNQPTDEEAEANLKSI
ncbi:hypothetical protein S7711_03667, partial [Stachybotrys chartarum IBT 7711]